MPRLLIETRRLNLANGQLRRKLLCSKERWLAEWWLWETTKWFVSLAARKQTSRYNLWTTQSFHPSIQENKWFLAAAIGPVVVRCGEIGSAAIAKIASNMLAFLNMAGGVECMALAKNAGLDLETFFDAIRASAGNSFAWETVMFRVDFCLLI